MSPPRTTIGPRLGSPRGPRTRPGEFVDRPLATADGRRFAGEADSIRDTRRPILGHIAGAEHRPVPGPGGVRRQSGAPRLRALWHAAPRAGAASSPTIDWLGALLRRPAGVLRELAVRRFAGRLAAACEARQAAVGGFRSPRWCARAGA